MQVTKKEAEKIFRKLGVKLKKGGPHVRGWIELDGKKVIPVYYSHGRGDMPGRIGDKFRRSFQLGQDEFERLRDCPMSAVEYFSILKSKIC